MVTKGCNWQGDAFKCPGVPDNGYTLTMTPQAMAFVDVLLQRRFETAGALAVNYDTKTLDILQTDLSKGKRDTVSIPRGAILAFHVHIGKCPPRGADCALDVPSDADMALVMEDCMQGTWSHLVFSHTGTFVTSLQPGLRRHLGALSGAKRKAAEKQIEKRFAAIHKDFERRLQKGSIDLARFRPEWMAFARNLGFDATFFPKGQLPRITILIG